MTVHNAFGADGQGPVRSLGRFSGVTAGNPASIKNASQSAEPGGRMDGNTPVCAEKVTPGRHSPQQRQPVHQSIVYFICCERESQDNLHEGHKKSNVFMHKATRNRGGDLMWSVLNGLDVAGFCVFFPALDPKSL
ncbi:MAG: hypothetical protein ACLSHU_00235 [Oscillospiraceae bacterium]